MMAENPSNPLNLVAGSLYQYLSVNSSNAYYTSGVSGAFTSWDGGRTWTDRTLPQNSSWTDLNSSTCDMGHLADTAIGFGPHNTVYYVDLSYPLGNLGCLAATSGLALYVTISNDGGNTWNTPIGLAGMEAGATVDKPWIAVDSGTGEVYVAYNDDTNNTISVRNSTDNGRTWGAQVNLTNASSVGGGGIGVELAVDPSGGVDATWSVWGLGVYFARSTDRAHSFSTAQWLGPAPLASSSPDGFRVPLLPGLGIESYLGTPDFGRIFCIWQNGTGGAGGTPIVTLRFSSDNGANWSNATRVDSNASLMDFQPDVTAGPDGTVYAEWYGERFSNGHYRLYATESHDGGQTFDPQFAVSDNESVPVYRATGAAWWIGDYTHIMADQNGARPLWTDARSPLATNCSPCLWGVDYNISMYTAEVTNLAITANVPVNVTVNGTIPAPGNLSVGPGTGWVDALVGDTVNLTAPAEALVNGSSWAFASWFGSTDSANQTLNLTVAGTERWTACYVPVPGELCQATGAPGYLVVNVHPTSATVRINGGANQTAATPLRLLERPGAYFVEAWTPGYWSVSVTRNVTPGTFTYANLTLAAVPGTLTGTLMPGGAVLRANTTTIPVAANGTFSALLTPGTYRLSATLFGYDPYLNSSVGIRYNQTTVVPIALSPIPGWINGTVFPVGASVTLNGAALPTVDGAYSVRETLGTYWVNATAPGYYPNESGPLNMTPFGRVSANLSLVLIVGVLAGDVTPVNAAVFANGRPLNLSEGNFSESVVPGNYTLTASARGYIPMSAPATVQAGLSTVVWLILVISPGWISGTVSPTDASLLLDGRPVSVGSDGAFNATVAAGTHHLKSTAPGYGELDRAVVVQPGVTTAVALGLSPVATSAFPGVPLLIGLVVIGVLAAALIALVWYRRKSSK